MIAHLIWEVVQLSNEPAVWAFDSMFCYCIDGTDELSKLAIIKHYEYTVVPAYAKIVSTSAVIGDIST